MLGFDASERSLEAAREHAREAGLEIDYRLALAEQFEPDATFDVVTADYAPTFDALGDEPDLVFALPDELLERLSGG